MSEHTSQNDPNLNAVSNAIHLSGRQWIGVGFFTAAFILIAPMAWKQVEPMDVEKDYRMPFNLNEDYWLYDRYSRIVSLNYETALLGDSVVWGQYVTRRQTLSHYLNEEAGRERFADLGLNGAHPTALASLVEHYAKSIRGKNVIVQCNPLWLSSPEHDLQTEQKFGFNHPRLLPQFIPEIPFYRAHISARLSIVIGRQSSFSAWTGHLQHAYFDDKDIPSWTLEHPYENPMGEFTHGLPQSDNDLHADPISWAARGIKPQDFDWVDLDTSIQWGFFRRTIEILQRRENHVFVLLGPFNEHMLTEKGLAGYQKIRTGMETWFRDEGIDYWSPQALPSPDYADASHPLSRGYASLAGELFLRLK
jgi:hypothetical protein